MSRRLICFALACLLFSLVVFAGRNENKEKKKKQEASSFQHHVVVTATRLEAPSREIASSISVITEDDLEQKKRATILEALQEVAGISIIQNGAAGGAASVFIRGANSEHTLVMMDGVELNDPITPSRSYDLAHYSLNNVERIEVLRGPQSTLYGQDALSGVINIITKKGQGKPRLNLSSFGGSYGTYQAMAGISGSDKKIYYSLGASFFRTSGLSAASTAYEGNQEKDGYRNFTLYARGGFRASNNLDFDFVVRSVNTKIDIDNFGGAYGDDPNNIQEYDALFVKSEARALLLQNRWEQKLSLSVVNYNRQHENPTDPIHLFDSDRSRYKSSKWKLDWQHNLFLHNTNILTIGVEHQQEQGESEYLSESQLWGISESIFPQKKTHITGIYVQDQIKLADRFFAAVGARLDNHKQFCSSLTYRLAPAYFIKKSNTKLKATLGTGFKAPSLYQLYAPGTIYGPIGNEDLKPEKSTGLDIGFEQQFLIGKVVLGATYFFNQYKHLIKYSMKGFKNIGSAESKGIELFIKAHPHRTVAINAAYTRIDAKDKDTGTELLRRPKDRLTVSMEYSFQKKANLAFSMIYIGKRKDEFYSGWTSSTVTMPSYFLLNAVASYELIQNTQIYLRLENILDEKYEMIKGYGTPGFSIYGGVKLSL
ncbi:TonB-dependent receptor plug domain-containing protein [Acidobacteriota bacterium]